MTSANTFQHPTCGKTSRDPNKLAILWQPGSAQRARAGLLKQYALRPIKDPGGQGKLRVNQSDAMTWAESTTGKAIADKSLLALEQSDAVHWISGVYKGESAPQGPEGLFSVNPTRLYLSSAADAQLGGVASLDIGAHIDQERGRRLRNQVVLCVDSVCVPEGRSAIELAQQLGGALKKLPSGDPTRDIRFENIPLISPECAGPPARLEYLPNDPQFASQWGLRRIQAPHAWNVTKGDPDIVVAVIDQGVELGHPDLSLHPDSWNATFDLPDGGPVGNHGTACAGIVAGTIDNGQGMVGVAGRCRIMAIATSTWADVDIAEGLYFAADHGAHVVSMSFGVYPSWGIWDFDIIRDALQYALEKGLVLVAASGNENINQARFPGSDARTICVGGTNREDLRKAVGDSSIETFWGACFGPDLDVVAPCLEIPTTDRLGAAGYSAGDYFDRFNGTSSATPHVAGLAGLILSVRPDLSNEEVREIIETTCDKIRPGSYGYSYVGQKANGTWNDEVGYGLVNAERAVLVACDYGRPDDAEACKKPCVQVPRPKRDCVGPESPPWKDYDSCLFWYENRFVVDPRGFCQVRIIYEHCLRLLGRQQGPLLYTTTLLPGETVRLYSYDRYRRVRSETQRLSIYASLRQSVSSIWEARTTQRESRYQEFLEKVRSDDDSSFSVGGMLFPVSWNIDDPDPVIVSLLVGASTESVSSEFQQTVQSATQQIEAERSVVISTFEESEQRDVTSRTLTNANDCRAVTYYVRRVYECYELVTRVTEVSWRSRDPDRQGFGPWRPIDDLKGADDRCLKFLKEKAGELPKVGETVTTARRFAIPTDGTLYQAELAHCPSCEPEKQARLRVELERAHSEARRVCAEVELLELEASRRRRLLEAGDLTPFEDLEVIGEPL